MGEHENLVAKLGSGRIEWYPSAGSDLQNIRSAFHKRGELTPRPTIFIHTDWWYAEGSRDDFSDEIRDGDIVLRKAKEYPRLQATSHGFCVFARESAPDAGRCVEYEGSITKDDGCVRHFIVIKVAIENEQFAAEFLLPNQVSLEALVHKNSGWGCGGGSTVPGTWMRGVLLRLKAKFFITDPHGMKGARPSRICWIEGEMPGFREVSRVFPVIGENVGERVSYRDLWQESWELFSPHGVVKCFAVAPYETEDALKKSVMHLASLD